MGVAPARAAPRRPSGWAAASLAAALVVALPLLVLPLSFVDPSDSWRQIAPRLLPEALANSLLLAAGVGLGTLVLGTALAVLISFYDFPGRGWLEWALVLPLAMPGYVLTFVLLGQYDAAAAAVPLPDLRSAGGAILVLTVVLYPYVYLLGRAALVGQSRRLIEAARSLGSSELGAVTRVALPLARPALAAGAALAVMEALADFGTVNLLGFHAMTDAIYRVWYGAFDRQGALQLGTLLLGLVLLMLALERISRRRRTYAQATGRGDEVPPRRLHGWRGALACALPSALLALAFAGPVVQLLAWSVASLGDGTFDAGVLGAGARNSVLLAFLAAVVAVFLATVVAYGLRVRATRTGTAAARVASIGYAVPGSVVAAAVFVALGWIDDLAGLVLAGTVVGLLAAYVVRFMALALHTAEAHLERVPRDLDAAARSLGADRSRVLAEIHAPLLVPGVLTAALLVFVEVMKELPATVLLRPLGLDTLAVAVWEATRESLYQTAAFPALLIVAVGLVPVVLLVRLSDPRSLLER